MSKCLWTERLVSHPTSFMPNRISSWQIISVRLYQGEQWKQWAHQSSRGKLGWKESCQSWSHRSWLSNMDGGVCTRRAWCLSTICMDVESYPSLNRQNQTKTIFKLICNINFINFKNFDISNLPCWVQQ